MPGGISGMDMYACPNRYRSVYARLYQSHDLGELSVRRPSPTAFYGVESIMDDIAYKLGMDPVDVYALKNMLRPTAGQPFTNYSLEDCIALGAERFNWHTRRNVTAWLRCRADQARGRFSFMMFRAALGYSSADPVQVDAQQRYTLFVGVTDVGPGAKTTMGMIAAEALGVPLSQVEVVSGDTDRCPVLGG